MLAKRVIIFSDFAFLLCSSSTKFIILLKVEFSYSFFTSIWIKEVKLMLPEKRVSPSLKSFGRDSPFKEERSNEELPLRMTPSSGTFSPGLISMISPIFTWDGSLSTISSPWMTCAINGMLLISFLIDCLLFDVA